MADENVEILRELYGAYNRRPDREELALLAERYAHHDVEWWPAQEPAPRQGREGVINATQGWFDAWDDLQIKPEDFEPWDRGLLVRVRVSGRGHGSGLEMEERFFHLFEMEDGRIRRFREYAAEGEAREGAGLP